MIIKYEHKDMIVVLDKSRGGVCLFVISIYKAILVTKYIITCVNYIKTIGL